MKIMFELGVYLIVTGYLLEIILFKKKDLKISLYLVTTGLIVVVFSAFFMIFL